MTPFDLPASAEASCADAYLGFIDRVPQAAYFQTALEHLLPTISQSYSLADVSVMEQRSRITLHMRNTVIKGGLLGNTVLLRVHRV